VVDVSHSGEAEHDRNLSLVERQVVAAGESTFDSSDIDRDGFIGFLYDVCEFCGRADSADFHIIISQVTDHVEVQHRYGFFQREEKINRIDRNGKRQGPCKEYYETDQVKNEGSYTDDLKDGLFKEYAQDGRVIKKEEYRMGELIPDEKEEKEK